MSSSFRIPNINEVEENYSDKEMNLSSNIKYLKPIKIKNNIKFKSSQNQTSEINTKSSFSLKQDEHTKGNRLLKYLNNIFKKGNEIKDFPLKSRNKNISLINYTSTNTNETVSSIKDSNKYFFTINSICMSPKSMKKYYKNPNYIRLNSLFNLPYIYNKNNPLSYNNSEKNIDTPSNFNLLTEVNINNKNSTKNKRLSLIKLNNNLLRCKSTDIKDNEKTEEMKNNKMYNSIYNFMKFKFYEDVDEKMEKKLRDDLFLDKGLKNKIRDMEKIGVFWKNVFDYCNPKIYSEKFRYINKERKNSFDIEDSIGNINKNKMPNQKLYTNIVRSQIVHYKNKYKILNSK
jgi:hypothetical protein